MERIAKRLASCGIASRRTAEAMIQEGRVSVNGIVLTTPAHGVDESDIIAVDGRIIGGPIETRLWIFHKPRGFLTTQKDPQQRPTLWDLLPPEMPRVVSVGRLDLMSEGLILLTTQGALARELELPKNQLPRVYQVRVHGRFTTKAQEAMKKGLTIEGIIYDPVGVRVMVQRPGVTWIEMTLTQGKNREIRNMITYFGCRVGRLLRVRYGPYTLDDLPERGLKEVSLKPLYELKTLKHLKPLIPAGGTP